VSFHREMMRLASEALERVPREDREIASLTFSARNPKAEPAPLKTFLQREQ
jgi:hypothetical protein